MATLNWKTPNGTTGSLNLDNIVTSVATGSTNGTIAVNGNNVAVKGLGSAAYTASTTYAAASHTHSYLPLSGGTMTGGITFTIGIAIKSNNNTGGTTICGGSSTDATAGAKLGLYGSSNSDNAGRFLLQAGNSSGTYKQLNGWPDGTLTWGGADILTASEHKAINGYISFSNGIIIQWGHASTGSNKYVDITYPIAFPTRMDSIIVSDAFTSGSGSTTEVPNNLGVFTWMTEAYKSALYKTKCRIGASGSNEGFVWIAVGH